jgi:hypothetical protein
MEGRLKLVSNVTVSVSRLSPKNKIRFFRGWVDTGCKTKGGIVKEWDPKAEGTTNANKCEQMPKIIM